MKTYFGTVKEKSGQYGTFHNISFKREDLEKMIENLNEKGYINLTMNKRKEDGKYGETHSLTLNDYKPQGNQGQYAKPEQKEEISVEDIHF